MKYLVLLFAAIAQLGVVGWMIGGREWTLYKGREVKFATRPVDPSDPFRGRYVALDFDASTFKTDKDDELNGKTQIYAVLAIDSEGYATVDSLTAERPCDGTAYIALLSCRRDYVPFVQAKTVNDGGNKPDEKPLTAYRLKFPFDRYYMNEKAAPEAERRYRETSRAARDADTPEAARRNYLAVHVLEGKAVASGLFIDNRPIEELLRDGN